LWALDQPTELHPAPPLPKRRQPEPVPVGDAPAQSFKPGEQVRHRADELGRPRWEGSQVGEGELQGRRVERVARQGPEQLQQVARWGPGRRRPTRDRWSAWAPRRAGSGFGPRARRHAPRRAGRARTGWSPSHRGGTAGRTRVIGRWYAGRRCREDAGSGWRRPAPSQRRGAGSSRGRPDGRPGCNGDTSAAGARDAWRTPEGSARHHRRNPPPKASGSRGPAGSGRSLTARRPGLPPVVGPGPTRAGTDHPQPGPGDAPHASQQSSAQQQPSPFHASRPSRTRK
jgi:hypothetical protein